MDRMDREKQEESNLCAMLRADIERLNTDRWVIYPDFSFGLSICPQIFVMLSKVISSLQSLPLASFEDC